MVKNTHGEHAAKLKRAAVCYVINMDSVWSQEHNKQSYILEIKVRRRKKKKNHLTGQPPSTMSAKRHKLIPSEHFRESLKNVPKLFEYSL